MQAWGTRGEGGGVGGGFTSEASKKNLFLGLHPILSRVFRFALVSSSLAILSARSTIKFKKYEKIEGCEETNLKPPLVTWGAFHSNAFERKFPWKVSERIEMVAFRNRNHSIENSWNFRMVNQIQWKFADNLGIFFWNPKQLCSHIFYFVHTSRQCCSIRHYKFSEIKRLSSRRIESALS